MTISDTLKITIKKTGDAWCATAEELDCVGIGPTKECALDNLMFSIHSTEVARGDA